MRNFISIIMLFLLVGSSSCEYLTVCDAKRYQLKVKNKLPNGLCEFKFYADGDCLTWADRKSLIFVDSCKAYGISQMVWRDDIKKKYGI
jgi:hypothetical protein